jgi:amidohydrolase
MNREEVRAYIQAQARALLPELIGIRRHLHRHPELSFEEFQTSAFLKEQLRKYQIPFSEGWVETGILGRIEGGKPGKIRVLRGDMDALPIQESNTCMYASAHAGVMHACGHDVHSTCVLGAGIILQSLREEISGTVQLLFQPGEEKLPGGARKMLDAGIFNSEKPDALLALHVFPELLAGHVGFRSGMYMASTDELYFTVKGKGGHGAMPQQLRDPVLAASALVMALQQVSSRLAPPTIPTVLSIGKFDAAGITNVVPDKVHLEGTFRTMDETWRAQAHVHIERIARATALQYDVEIETDIRKGYPVLTNHPEITAKARAAALEMLPLDQVHELAIRMTAEDFAWFAQEFPVCFFRLGTQAADGRFAAGVHTSVFDIDESAIETGVAQLAWMAWNLA